MHEMNHYSVTKSSVGKPGGRYASKSGPAAAAKKAASKRFGKGTKLRLTVRELGSDREFTYDAARIKLAKPVVRKIKGVTITSEYRVDVRSVHSKTTGGGENNDQFSKDDQFSTDVTNLKDSLISIEENMKYKQQVNIPSFSSELLQFIQKNDFLREKDMEKWVNDAYDADDEIGVNGVSYTNLVNARLLFKHVKLFEKKSESDDNIGKALDQYLDREVKSPKWTP
jgi:hypothetical protein